MTKKLPSTPILLNLDRRTDRLEASTQQLVKAGIDFQRFSAIDHPVGMNGVKLSMVEIFKAHLFRYPIEVGKVPLIVFEDDITFNKEKAGEFLAKVMQEELPEDFDLLFLGANIWGPYQPFTENLVKVDKAVANHAMVYSWDVLLKLIAHYEDASNISQPTDILINIHILPAGNSYCINPPLCVQTSGYSDIQNRYIDYTRMDWHDQKPKRI